MVIYSSFFVGMGRVGEWRLQSCVPAQVGVCGTCLLMDASWTYPLPGQVKMIHINKTQTLHEGNGVLAIHVDMLESWEHALISVSLQALWESKLSSLFTYCLVMCINSNMSFMVDQAPASLMQTAKNIGICDCRLQTLSVKVRVAGCG